jgi:hypothetical protein
MLIGNKYIAGAKASTDITEILDAINHASSIQSCYPRMCVRACVP